MDVALVGAGRVGTALGVLLARAGHRIVAASGGEESRDRVRRFLGGTAFVDAAEAAASGEVVVLGVPDDAIAAVCGDLALLGSFRAGQSVLHLSGAVPLEALAAAGRAGARVLALHPLQTFPDVESALERLPGSAVAVTAADEGGWALGERLARDVGGRPFRLADGRKPLYHAGAVLGSGFLAAAEALAARVLGAAGVEDPLEALAPLSRAALENALRLGPAVALTGPVARGDAGTLRRNLEALSAHAPEAVAAYVALADAALDLAEEAGRLDAAGRARAEEVLARWR